MMDVLGEIVDGVCSTSNFFRIGFKSGKSIEVEIRYNAPISLAIKYSEPKPIEIEHKQICSESLKVLREESHMTVVYTESCDYCGWHKQVTIPLASLDKTLR